MLPEGKVSGCGAERSDLGLPPCVLAHTLRRCAVDSLPALRRTCAYVHEAASALLARDGELSAALRRHLAELLGRSGKRVWVGVRMKPCTEGDGCLHRVRNSLSVGRVGAPGMADGTPLFFDRVFDSQAGQDDVWSGISGPFMRSIMRKEHCCILAYGQTGSGKTHTMFGNPEAPGEAGLAYRATQGLGELLRQWSGSACAGKSPLVEFSFLEVYNEAVFDLLNNQRPVLLKAEKTLLRPGGKFHGPVYSEEERIVPHGLTRRKCDLDRIQQQVGAWLHAGAASRTVARTAFNPRSSRSHAVATLHVTVPQGMQLGAGSDPSTASAAASPALTFRPPPRLPGTEAADPPCSTSEFRIHLVDLAGSERAGQHALSKKQQDEGSNINKSLSTLGRVVGALARGKGEHVPLRDSKLTWLLSGCITGRDARAFLIANVHPGHQAETVSTLRYAQQYSTLQSDLSTCIPQLVSLVRTQQARLSKLHHDFETHCISAARQPPGGWRRELLTGNPVLMVRRNAPQRVEVHPRARWSSGHQRYWLARAVGIQVSYDPDRPAPHEPDVFESMWALAGLAVAEPSAAAELAEPAEPAELAEPVEPTVEVAYFNRRGQQESTLWWPRSALDEIQPPASLKRMLGELQCRERELAQTRTRLTEIKERFAQQQREWLGGA